jgi:predicted transcriptional regulator
MGWGGLHRNDVKTDNRLKNLYWGTNHENAEDAVRNGRVERKLDAEKAREAVRLKGEGLTHLEIGERLGVSAVAIQKILRGKLWAKTTGIPPRKRDHFEGPAVAARVLQFHSWGWPEEALVAFLEVSRKRVRGILGGKSYQRVTGLGKQPTRNEVTRSKVPEILRLCNEEGLTTKQVAALLGVSIRKVQYVVKEHAARRFFDSCRRVPAECAARRTEPSPGASITH